MNFPGFLWQFLASGEQPANSCDLIFVLAGLPERKEYGWHLFRRGLAPRLMLSVGRFEVRSSAISPVPVPQIIGMRDKLPPSKRHFWIDVTEYHPIVVPASLPGSGTYGELHALASYLSPAPPKRIGLVSTSIHLRRVRYCCSQIPFFKSRELQFVAVPEEQSSFQRDGWWKRAGHWRYLLSEYVKLAGYRLIY